VNDQTEVPLPAEGEEPDLGWYAELVSKASDEEILAAFQRDRAALMDAIVGAMEQRFIPERAAGVEAVIQWDILDRPDGGTDSFQLAIANGTCRATRGTPGLPRTTLTIRPVPFTKLITGQVNPMKLFTFGKISIQGDLALAAKVSRFFELPQPMDPATGA
jgi:putative sterol carrier protein